jgi:hypothetical protein
MDISPQRYTQDVVRDPESTYEFSLPSLIDTTELSCREEKKSLIFNQFKI